VPARPTDPSFTIGYLALLAVFAVHAAVLMQAPVVGTAENGDFWRVMSPAGIASTDALASVDHKYVSQYYALKRSNLTSGFSSAAVVALAAKWVRGGGAPLDIRQVGATYLALYGGAFALALGAGLAPLLAALLAWAALDLSYSLYFNSFFADATALLGILGVVLALLVWPAEATSGWRRAIHHALLLGAALCAGFSKNMYMLTPLIVAAAVAIWPAPQWLAHLRRSAVLIGALVAGAALCAWHFTYGSGYRFPAINNHHVVFHGLADVADDPAALLAELGVDPQYAGLAGSAYFDLDAADKARSSDAVRNVSRGAVLWAYLRHPLRLARAVAVIWPVLRDARTADPNFADRTRPPSFYTAWWQFAALRSALWGLACLLWLSGAGALLIAARRRHWGGRHAALAFALLNAGALIIACILGDGLFGLHRHTMGVRFSLDLALVIELYALAGLVIALHSRRRATTATAT
jgi:hypothetical protein